ncbi:MAG: hypothetical protein QOI24_2410 [Acidobacteriota bacterium]|jgi:CHAT domain-containing protein|nr:hypothetical protein [Acidobacteriota bacterium]
MTSSGQRNGRYLAIAIAVVIAIGAAALIQHFIRNRGLAPLVRAANAIPHRVFASRVTGGFAYRPFLPAVKRGSDLSSSPDAWRVAGFAAEVTHAAQQEATPESLHRAGIAYLVAGGAERAVAALEDSLRREAGTLNVARAVERSNNAELLSDLAAAYLARANGEDSVDLLSAMNAAERASRIAMKPEILWNRALAVSAASSRDAATSAWRDYLAVDGGSQWGAEARLRMAAASADGPASRDAVKRMLLAATGEPDDGALLHATAAGPGYARVFAEEELLPAWGGGDDASLAIARRVGAAVARVSGDFVVADSIRQIDALGARRATEARAAVLAFGRGRAALNSYKYDEASPLLQSAESELRTLGMPLASRAGVFVATLHFYAKQPEPSLAQCAEVVRGNDGARYPSIDAQCAWNEGTIETGRRHFDRAKAAYESARTIFSRMGDVKSVAALDVRLAENDRWTGDVANAWSHMSRALRNGAAERGYIVLSEAARLAEGGGLSYAALSFYDTATDAARAARSAAEETDGHLSLAQLFWKLGREDDARVELNAASRSKRAIGDRTVADRLESDVVLARSTMTLATRPEEVVRQLEATIADLTTRGNHRRIAQARLLQAKAHLARHDFSAAEQSLLATLAEIDSQRGQISTDDERLAFVDTARDATELLVALQFDAKRTDDALRTADRSKARLLLDDDSPGPLASPARDEAFLEFFVLRDRVLAWTVTDRGTRTYTIAVDREELERRVTEWQGALMTGDEARVRSGGAELFNLLLAPLWQEVTSSRKLIFSADGVLYRLPYAALAPPRGGFLVDDHDPANVPSLTWLAAQRRTATPFHFGHLVTVVPSAGDERYARLLVAEQDAREIASRFPGATVLTGGEGTAARVAEAARDAVVLHFAGHAVVDETRPGLSALVMSDGKLLASDIARWSLQNTNLVVLAACSTGSGRVTSDGTASLARAFLLAGSHSAIATSWPVDDAAAGELSRHFYSELAAGASPPDALRNAQKSVIQNSKRPQYDWAAFQYIGP